MSRSGIVSVRMVITEEKILSNIDKVHRMINPKSKKQIVQLDEDAYFKDLIESIKTYLVEYPKKKNFPASVYRAAYDLVEFATSQFEENTKQIEELIRQRETNISLANNLKDSLEIIQNREEGWKEEIKSAGNNYSEDITEALTIVGKNKAKGTEDYENAVKLNLESNLHIEIDMERIEDRSKALSYIGIEVADALKLIPTPQEEIETVTTEETTTKTTTTTETVTSEETTTAVQDTYTQDTTFDVKPSLWQRIKQSKIGRAIRYAFKVKVVLDVPALPEGRDNN